MVSLGGVSEQFERDGRGGGSADRDVSVSEGFGRSERCEVSYEMNRQPEKSTLLISEVILPEDRTLAAVWLVNGSSESDAPRKTLPRSEQLLLRSMARGAKDEAAGISLVGNDIPLDWDMGSIHPEMIRSGEVLFFEAKESADPVSALKAFIGQMNSAEDPLRLELKGWSPEPQDEVLSLSQLRLQQELSLAGAAAKITSFIISDFAETREQGDLIGLNDRILPLISHQGSSLLLGDVPGEVFDAIVGYVQEELSYLPRKEDTPTLEERLLKRREEIVEEIANILAAVDNFSSLRSESPADLNLRALLKEQ